MASATDSRLPSGSGSSSGQSSSKNVSRVVARPRRATRIFSRSRAFFDCHAVVGTGSPSRTSRKRPRDWIRSVARSAVVIASTISAASAAGPRAPIARKIRSASIAASRPASPPAIRANTSRLRAWPYGAVEPAQIPAASSTSASASSGSSAVSAANSSDAAIPGSSRRARDTSIASRARRSAASRSPRDSATRAAPSRTVTAATSRPIAIARSDSSAAWAGSSNTMVWASPISAGARAWLSFASLAARTAFSNAARARNPSPRSACIEPSRVSASATDGDPIRS